MLLRFCISLILIFFYINTRAQVSNNRIANRFNLHLDSDPITSTTSGSNVEWQCINKALTSKCLVYHNDQWFSFKVEKAGNYFLNLSNQQCRKQQGLQVILIEGNPCEVRTYSILQCISKVSQEDTYVELPDVKPNTLYLLNIDGFLGDICSFNIQLASRPFGLPIRLSVSDSVKVKSSINAGEVHLSWKATPELINSIETFKVGRKSEQEVKSKWNEVELKVNAYGEVILDYSFKDTLKEQGTYTYLILGIKKETSQPVLLHERRINYFEQCRNFIGESKEQTIYFYPGFEKPARIQLAIVDAYTDALLKNSIIEYNPKKDKNLSIQTAQMIDKEVRNFVVQIKNLKTFEIKRFYFRLNEDGRFHSYIKGQ